MIYQEYSARRFKLRINEGRNVRKQEYSLVMTSVFFKVQLCSWIEWDYHRKFSVELNLITKTAMKKKLDANIKTETKRTFYLRNNDCYYEYD